MVLLAVMVKKILTIYCMKSTVCKVKSIKHYLELMALIKNIKLFLDSKQSNLNFQYSFVGISQVLRGRDSILNMNFKLENFGQLQILGGIRFVNKLFIKLVNSINISNQNLNGNVEIISFSKQLVQRSQNSQQTKK